MLSHNQSGFVLPLCTLSQKVLVQRLTSRPFPYPLGPNAKNRQAKDRCHHNNQKAQPVRLQVIQLLYPGELHGEVASHKIDG